MNTFNRITDFSIVTLFITNVWIILFTNILTFLSYLYPPTTNSQLLRPISFPNPFKIPLYLLLTITFVIIIWVFNTVKNHSNPNQVKPGETRNLLLKLFFLIILLYLFFSKLGSYPMAREYYPYALRPDKTIYNLVVFSYLLSIAFIIFELSIIYRFIKRSLLISTFYFLLIALVIAFFTFEARFPISGHDYSFFFGPILEIANGKTIYTDIPIQHGFLSILSMAFLYKLLSLKLFYLPAIIWLLYIIQYFLTFYLILRISKSIGLALIGLFSIINLNYFSLSELPVSYPQIGPMRWLPSLLTIFLLYKLKKIDNKILLTAVAFLSLWFIDAGISLVLGYLLTIFIFCLVGNIDIKRAIKTILLLCLNLIIIITVINILHLLFGYKLIKLGNIFHTLQKYTSLGIAQLPIPNQTYFWLVMLIYFASLIYFFKTSYKNKKTIQVGDASGRDQSGWQSWKGSHQRAEFFQPSAGSSTGGKETTGRIHFDSTILLFSANLMFFTSIYYLGRAHPHNLFNISSLPILTLFLLLGNTINYLNPLKKIILFIFIFSLFIIYPVLMRKISLSEMIIVKLKRLTQGQIFKTEMDEILTKRYSKELSLINKYLKESGVAIIHNDDTYLLYLTKKKNLLDANPQVGIDTKDDLAQAIDNFAKECPEKVAVDCSVFAKCQQYVGINQSGFYPGSLILAAVEKQCRIKYQPVECTKQLCIAQKK